MKRIRTPPAIAACLEFQVSCEVQDEMALKGKNVQKV